MALGGGGWVDGLLFGCDAAGFGEVVELFWAFLIVRGDNRA